MNKRYSRPARWRVLLVACGVAIGLIGCGSDAALEAPSSTHDQPSQDSASHGHPRGKDASDHDAHEGHGETPDRVELDADQRAALDLEIGTALAGSAEAVVTAPATLRFDADRVARVGPRLRAKVRTVEADLGDTVAAGDVLAVLDSVELGQAKAAYLTAAARYRTRAAAYERDRGLAEDQIVSESDVAESRADYRQAKAERRAARAELALYGMDEAAIDAVDDDSDAPLSRLALTAPRAGRIARRDLVAGETVGPDETPIHVVDNSRMWLLIKAAEKALPRIAVGQTVRFDVRPLPGETFTGRIDWIAPELDPESRSVRVRAVVDNPNDRLKAGMFATARIETGKARDSGAAHALVPIDAVQQIGERAGVLVPGEHAGAFMFTPVSTGAESGDVVEITQGLSPGDALVTAGAFDLKAALTAGGRSAAHSH
ncbi:efflux RND transporter periplasmic adaptor subunit [Salinisphaera orenii]|uniref:efflux RND transporter periplasmic adaptor subunit n=1 Tax=Salinisphaera orenii TaxID=856731 RepID=UPI000F46D9A7|nr:efflux RND transporter periplasmic adaptor subunit [Salinisphaera halophila]